jgi:hypothetical protein
MVCGRACAGRASPNKSWRSGFVTSPATRCVCGIAWFARRARLRTELTRPTQR